MKFPKPFWLRRKSWFPQESRGVIDSIESRNYTVDHTICKIRLTEDYGAEHLKAGDIKSLSMMQKWPVRRGRPYKEKLVPEMPLITGQRVIDTMFPIAKGGVAAVPGPFGSGKTVVQHQLAKWADADIVVYIGCGERGNEMTDVLMEFPELERPSFRRVFDEENRFNRKHFGHAGCGSVKRLFIQALPLRNISETWDTR